MKCVCVHVYTRMCMHENSHRQTRSHANQFSNSEYICDAQITVKLSIKHQHDILLDMIEIMFIL